MASVMRRVIRSTAHVMSRRHAYCTERVDACIHPPQAQPKAPGLATAVRARLLPPPSDRIHLCPTMRIFAPLAGALLAIMFAEAEAMVVPPWPIAPHDSQVGAESNVLDLLAASPDHHVLMRLLQRTRLVPEINRLQNHGTNLTFLAPLDSAWPPPIQDAFARDSVAEHTQQAALASFFNGTGLDPASVDSELADLLQYHIVNRSLLSQLLDPPASSGHHLESTLLVTHTGASEPGPDSTPLLTNNQQIFVNYTGNVTFGWSYGRTSNSSGTVRTAEGQYGLNCTKGVVVAVNRVLQRPPSLSTLIRTHSQLSLLSRLMDLGTGRFPFPVPLDSPDLTAFLPSDAALLPSTGNGLTPDESAWLEDPGDVLAAHDRAKLVAWHITADRKVIYRPSHERKQNITMALGGSYTLAPHRGGKRTQLGAANVIEESILVENGVVHLLDAALSPYRAPPARSILSMNMHRVLTARGAGQFADLLGKNGLGWAIDQPAWPTLEDIHEPSTESGPVHGSVPDRLTILALTDDFLTGLALPLNMSHGYLKKQKDQQGVSRENLRDQLSYHVLPAGWGLFNLTDPGMEVSSSKNWIQHRYLLPTELYPPGLGGRRQRLDVRIQIPLSEGSDEDDDHDPKGKRTHPGTRSSSGGVQVTFGGRAALDLEPITVGARGDILWFLRGALKPPKDVFNVLLGVGAGDLSQSSSSEGGVALFSSWLSATEKTRSLLERGENITGLVPRDDALSSQRLGKLLLNAITRSSFNLARVTEFAFVHDVMYTEDFPPRPSFDSRFEQVRLSSPPLPVFRTLEGGNVTLGSYRQPKGDALYAATPERGADVVSVLHGKQDLLTNTGVLHLVDSLLFPADLEITIVGRHARRSDSRFCLTCFVYSGGFAALF